MRRRRAGQWVSAVTLAGVIGLAPSIGQIVQYPIGGGGAAPVIDSINFALGDPLGGGLDIVFTGSGFTGATAVDFLGTAATSFVVDSDTQITAVLPAHAVGTGNATVTTPGGSANIAFRYWEPTQISNAAIVLRSDAGVTEVAGDVTNWVDQTANAYDFSGGVGTYPFFQADDFTPGIPGIVFSGTEFLDSSSGGIVFATGLSTYVGCKWVNVRSTPTQTDVDPPLTIIASSAGAASLNVGCAGQQFACGAFNSTVWKNYYRSCTLNDGTPRAFGWDFTSGGALEGYLNTTAIAAQVATGGYDATTQYDAIGKGFTGDDKFRGSIGYIVVTDGVISGADRALLTAWGQQRFSMSTTVPTAYFKSTLSTLALGPSTASDFRDNTSLVFTRTTASTVQTSASALDATGATDQPVVGNAGYGRGLVIQQNTFNRLAGTNAPRDLTDTWSAGSGTTITFPYADSPDGSGTGCSRANTNSGGYTNYGAFTTGCFSSWQRSKAAETNGNMQQIWITAAVADGVQVTRNASDTWARLILPSGGNRAIIDVSDCRDYSGSGGQTAQARDVLVDYIQAEDGQWASEAIPTSVTNRGPDYVDIPDVTNMYRAGVLNFYAKIIPKFASTQDVAWRRDATTGAGTQTDFFLTSSTASIQVRVRASDKKVVVSADGGGTDYVSTNAMSWSIGDVVEIQVSFGANSTSVCQYRKNAGAWTDLVLASVAESVSDEGIGALLRDILGSESGDVSAFPSWSQEFQCLPLGSSPP